MTRTGPRLRFRRNQRLSRARDFQQVYDARVSRRAGPLVIYAKPNQTPCHRLGLSVGRRVGTAVTRNLIKRRLREAFRTLQLTLPRPADRAYDLVINVRPHDPLHLADYQTHLQDAARALHETWSRRDPKGSP
jgi:ribonuclease P protein component